MTTGVPFHVLLCQIRTGNDQGVQEALADLALDDWQSPALAALIMARCHVPGDARSQCVAALLSLPPNHGDEDVIMSGAQALIVLDGVSELDAVLADADLDDDLRTYLKSLKEAVDNYRGPI